METENGKVKVAKFKFFLNIIIFIACVITIFFMIRNYASAAEKTPTQILIEDLQMNGVINRDDFTYHLICYVAYGGYGHFYSNVPITIRYISENGYHCLEVADTVYLDIYNKKTKNFILSGKTSDGWNRRRIFMSVTSTEDKSNILNYSYTKLINEESNAYQGAEIIYVSHGIEISNNTLQDLGYEKGSIFFFHGYYSSANNESPLAPATSTGGYTGPDSGMFSGWFSGLAESFNSIISNLATGITDFLKYLFVPDINNFNEKFNNVKSFYGFIDGIKSTIQYITNYFYSTTGKVPKITIDLSKAEGKYKYGNEAIALDMTWYSRFKPYGDAIVIGFCYIIFFWTVYRRLPDIISGAGAIVDKTSDITKYTNKGE